MREEYECSVVCVTVDELAEKKRKSPVELDLHVAIIANGPSSRPSSPSASPPPHHSVQSRSTEFRKSAAIKSTATPSSRAPIGAPHGGGEHQPDEPSIVLQNPQLAVHKGDTSHRRRFLGPHPLVPLLAEAEEDSTLSDPEAAARGAAEGDRVWCQVIGESPLGLSVAILPDGASGLVYTDEAGFAPEDGTGVPAALGDVVQGYVQGSARPED